jgi:hypothetical protein
VQVGDVNPSSFEAYEGIRILLPGAIAVTLYGGVVTTYGLSIMSPADNALAALVAALLVGILLLFLDLPVRSAAYRNPSLPDRELRRWKVDPSRFGDYLNLYYVMLDVSFPPTIRNRGLYTGSMFRIGFEGLYMAGLTSLGVLAAAATSPTLGVSRAGTTGTQVILVLTALGLVLVVLSAYVGRYLYRRRRHPRAEAIRIVRNDIRADLDARILIAAFPTLYALIAFLVTRDSIAGGAAIAIPSLAWTYFYFRGTLDPVEPGQRHALSPPTAVLLYAIASVIAVVEACLRISKHGTMNAATATAWGCVSLVVGVMIATRGHERKLVGSFKSQTTWMKLNKEKLLKEHGLTIKDDGQEALSAD